MSDFVDHLMQRDKLDLAKELARTAKDKAHLQREKLRLEVEVFWLKVKLREYEDSAAPEQR